MAVWEAFYLLLSAVDLVPQSDGDGSRDNPGPDAASGSVDVTSTLVNLGRAFGDVGTRSFAFGRVTLHGTHSADPAESGEFALSESSRRYEHIRLLGRGGMGIVDQVWDHDLMRKLAVKRLHPDTPGANEYTIACPSPRRYGVQLQ